MFASHKIIYQWKIRGKFSWLFFFNKIIQNNKKWKTCGSESPFNISLFTNQLITVLDVVAKLRFAHESIIFGAFSLLCASVFWIVNGYWSCITVYFVFLANWELNCPVAKNLRVCIHPK